MLRRPASLVLKWFEKPNIKHHTITGFRSNHFAGRSSIMTVSTLPLNDGNQDAIRLALDNGFTHLDGAQVYGNENTLGNGIVASGKSRSELFITTKLGQLQPGATPKSALQESLRKLKVDYVDLYLVHQASNHVGKLKEVWKGMEEAQKAGLTKSIGVSNFTADHLKTILEIATITPAVNQVEAHPYVWQALQPNLAIHDQYKIVTSSYAGLSPLFRGKGGPLDPVIEQIRARLQKTRGAPVSDGQVLNKWLQQKGVLVVTMYQELTVEEIALIDTTGAKLHKRYFPGNWPSE
ncbi:NADP-dependent oxidoreductase domain-containing protein [Suillus discolor]|uniref:NADP-dependent oxidoreductase domain-containing protein n=1 Tax=Suillus discolor TaxID=1912936 RepID=A0A9P7JW31_9AGAM|nr:NADP-dependent oxidoreductase domain-containing protein [Suillus discolor]KAG2111663.1 NADP-dependent oxidoreductase domain-containing protein [Suillus discolor]